MIGQRLSTALPNVPPASCIVVIATRCRPVSRAKMLVHVEAAHRRQQLLQRDDVGVELADHVDDALRLETPVDADAAVQVVGGDANARHAPAPALRACARRRKPRSSSPTATRRITAKSSIAQLSGRGSAMTARARSMKSA